MAQVVIGYKIGLQNGRSMNFVDAGAKRRHLLFTLWNTRLTRGKNKHCTGNFSRIGRISGYMKLRCGPAIRKRSAWSLITDAGICSDAGGLTHHGNVEICTRLFDTTKASQEGGKTMRRTDRTMFEPESDICVKKTVSRGCARNAFFDNLESADLAVHAQREGIARELGVPWKRKIPPSRTRPRTGVHHASAHTRFPCLCDTATSSNSASAWALGISLGSHTIPDVRARPRDAEARPVMCPAADAQGSQQSCRTQPPYPAVLPPWRLKHADDRYDHTFLTRWNDEVAESAFAAWRGWVHEQWESMAGDEVNKRGVDLSVGTAPARGPEHPTAHLALRPSQVCPLSLTRFHTNCSCR
ncbi:hypothetical protein K438DRAFT_1785833 [Mycena galopus ATCC 62051]|nr:hypothetical protein K438DRAFT_1785833 [Mycena galopus ATCC 62051]